ncbi:MAG: prepilin-type N-terminal cleavage/methylation domain-containing protein, partial [Bacilli bacterium]|nr:prepilin-type N-terminal cleavage/methylation domain-containing protein [Bacilli bacterium]
MKRKKDGFTLVELLATIIILGIILGLAVSAYGIYIQTTKNKAYQNAENVLKVSAINALTHCMTAPTGEFIKFCEVHKAPTNQFEYDIITGDDLIKYDYVDP